MYNEIPTIKDFEEKWAPSLQDKEFCYAFCYRNFPRISGAHLRSHADFLLSRRAMMRVRKADETIEIEQEMNPKGTVDPWMEGPEKLSEIYTRLFGATSLLKALVDKTFALYAPNRSEWTMMEHLHGKAEWTTITQDSTGWPWYSNYLTKDRLKEHFIGCNKVGVKARGNFRTKVIVLDKDALAQFGGTNSNAEALGSKYSLH